MNRTLIHILAALCLTASLPTGVAAQDYVAPPVTVSKEKVRSGGNVYYSHVVLERQTLYSISKAYGVTIEEIYESNPTLRLETDGLKKNQILMIPVREIPQADKAGNAVEAGDAAAPQEPKTVVEKKAPVNGPDDFFIHKVKWFEDLETIAKKYNVSKEAILNINGMTSDKIKRRQELKIPYHPEIWEGRTTVQEPEKAEEVVGFNPTEEDQPDTTAKEKKGIDDIFDDLFVREGKHDVSISMLIPFSSPRAGDRVSFMDMYCGSLLAARSMGRDGTNLDIHTFDVSGGAMPVT